MSFPRKTLKVWDSVRFSVSNVNGILYGDVSAFWADMSGSAAHILFHNFIGQMPHQPRSFFLSYTGLFYNHFFKSRFVIVSSGTSPAQNFSFLTSVRNDSSDSDTQKWRVDFNKGPCTSGETAEEFQGVVEWGNGNLGRMRSVLYTLLVCS